MTVLIQDYIRDVGANALFYSLADNMVTNISIANNNNGQGVMVKITMRTPYGGTESFSIPPYTNKTIESVECNQVIVEGTGANISIIITTEDELISFESTSVDIASQFPTTNRNVSLYVRKPPLSRVVCQDDFEASTFKWTQEPGGTIARAVDVNTFEGIAYMKLTTAASIGATVTAKRGFGFVPYSIAIAELYWAMLDADETLQKSFVFRLTWDNGTNEKSGAIIYDKNQAPANNWRTLTFPISGSSEVINAFSSRGEGGGGNAQLWHYLRIVADFTSQVPVLLELHTDALDLIGLKVIFGTAGATQKRGMVFDIQGSAQVATATNYGVDQFLLAIQGI